MKSSIDKIRNNENKKENLLIKKNNIISPNEIENINNIKKKNIKIQEYKKFLFNEINGDDDNSSLVKENINVNNKIKVIVESSSLFSDLKNAYGISSNEYIINSLNSSILTNFSLSQNDNEFKNQIQNQNIIVYKKSLKNDETPSSNINQSSNLDSNKKPMLKCTCKNSNCLKFYCECFASGRFCDNCSCKNCKNTHENKELRQEKYNIIISRNPKAIQKINSTKRSWTCKCINSNCSKKYCDCYHNGRFCTSKCRCINCLNKNIGINNNYNQKRIKRVRGINKEKMNKIISRKIKKNKIIINNENINYNENCNNEDESKGEREKNIINSLMKFYTPKKQRNNNYENIYNNYQNESTTIGFTGKKERKIFENKTEQKKKDIYTKLQMDIKTKY
jgi:hypothetical protein